MLKPIKLVPEFKEIIWGGNKLKTDYNKVSDLNNIAESWELTVRDDGMNIIADGEFAGLTMQEYIDKNGFEVVTKLRMIAEVPAQIEQDSAFYRLCVARAVSDVYYNDRLIKHEPEVVWNTLAYAVTLNEFKMNDTEDYVNMIGLSDWEADAYFGTLYPTLDESKTALPENGYVVSAHFGTGEKYLVEPHLFEKFCTDEFFGVTSNSDGTYSVKILIHDQRAPEIEFDRDRGLAVIVKADANSPFGYIIKDVVDCDLPKG